MTTRTQTKRTPGPWFYVPGMRMDGFHAICCTDVEQAVCAPRDPIGDENGENAKFIVHACNIHDELIAGLQTLLNTFDSTTYHHLRSAITRRPQLSKQEIDTAYAQAHKLIIKATTY